MENKNNIIVNQVDPTTFEYQQYTEKDTVLISSSRLDTTFSSSIDYIEYYAYAEDQTLIFPDPNSSPSVYDNKNYKVINGDIILNPIQDLENLGYDQGNYFSTYNFYRKRLFSDINRNYYIDEISSDRTEIRLKSSDIDNEVIIASTQEFITYREEQDFFVDFYLNFGADQQIICNNISLDTQQTEPSVLVKLYEPLPSNFEIKDTLWVVEEISSPQAYNIKFPAIEFIPDDFQFLSGPNYSIQVTQQTGESSACINLNTLVESNLTSSYQQLKNVLNRKEIDISVDYTNYNNFVYFSSALTRLENFYYKVGLIQSSSAEIENLPTNSATYSASKAELTTSIDNIIKNFDGYEYFLYFNSGSEYSYPKSNSEPPYILVPTSSATALTWLGSADPNSGYYGGQALSASNYDEGNSNYLYYAIPEYLRDDSANQKYILFVDMVGQQYDNTWLYTKNITTRFDADNRLDYGISKDLVADAIRDFGVKLYSNNFNTDDLYTAFLGITPSGSAFPFPDITGSYPAPSGYEYVNTKISASNDIVPLDNVNKQLYKRIYHNIPYLLKTKGTLAGLKALITSYGVPDTILRVNEFGGKDRNDFRDWDYEQNVFNYALHLDGENSQLTSSFKTSPNWPEYSLTETTPKSIQFRFKTPGIPTSSAYYNLVVAEDTTNSPKWYITLEYTGSGMNSGSYSGSVASASNAYGTLRLYPDGNNDTSVTASIDAPFFDGGWWSAMATIDYDALNTGSLFAANRIGDKIGFSGSDSVGAVTQYWRDTQDIYFPSSSGLVVDAVTYLPLTGALQEVRYWDVPLSESLFYDYVMNPYSIQGNTLNNAPDTLVFRADLGTQLNTGSRESIHPKVTGSWVPTSSFNSDSTFFISGSFISNTESIYLNQVPGGIKNRISDKVRIDQEVLPTGSTLSPYRSIQQETYPSGSSPSINYLEVAFSPTDQVNDDIIAQIGAFNIGDYIGDPRQISESGVTYPQLDTLRDAYFTKYINSYDVNDFVRLIKFFDNSLFKMIEDFTPARTTLSSGVVIKQNLLERNRQAPPSMSYSTPEYSGSIKSAARDFQVPNSSSSFPQYSTISGSSIEVFNGGTGGVFEPYNSIFAAPISTSNAPICIENYIYSSSYASLSINTSSGHWTLANTDVSNTTNTMSISVSSSDNRVNSELFSLLSSSANHVDSYITAYPSSSNEALNISWKVDRGIYYSGYGGGDDNYGEAPYGDFTQMYQFYLTVNENNLDGATAFGDLDIFKLCFQEGGEPYSGETAANVSASSLFKTYPDFQQSWTESIVPSLGITPAYQQQNSSSNHLPPVRLQRIDQREFYNGEFGGAIPVGPTDICSAFFGQNAIIDYFFYIQWFTADNFNENAFLTSSNLPLDGNVWFWTDVSGSTFTGIPKGQELTITQQPFSNYPNAYGQGQGNLSASFSQDSTSGTGTGLVVGITQSYIGSGPGVEMVAIVESTGSGYAINDTVTINSTTLNNSVFSGLLQNVIAPITQQPYSSYPGQSGQGNPPITASISTTSTSGAGTGIVLGVTQSFIGNGPNIQMSAVIEATGSGYIANDTVTITQATLNSSGFSSANQDAVFTLNNSVFTAPTADQNLIITLGANDIITTTSSISNKVKYIKMSNVDANGESILPFIQDSEYVTFNLTGAQDAANPPNLIEGYQTWYISNTGLQDDNIPSTTNATLIIVNPEPSSNAVTSYDSQFYDLSFSASGIFSYYATSSGEDPNVLPDTGFTASVPQGYFPPVDNFPTESFFRGWGKSNYFQSNTDGTVYRVETGSGFSSDTLGNFNTGSVELDFDTSIPYTASSIPWFINATASTYQALSGSSLVGDLTTSSLQLYTGSITASAIPLGPAFNIYSTITPTEDTNIITSPITIPISIPISMLCNPNLQLFVDSGNFAGGVAQQVVFASQNSQWQAEVINYSPGYSNWVNLDKTGGVGDDTITVTVDDGPEPSGTSTEIRTAELRVYITAGFGLPEQSVFCTITQIVNSTSGYQFNP